MTFFQAIVLGVVQGLTEFLPVSSSGHLVLAGYLLGVEEPGGGDVTFEVVVHLGTLFAVLIYFRKRVFAVAVGCFQRAGTEARKTLFLMIIGTLPAVIAYKLFGDAMLAAYAMPHLVGILLCVTGGLLLLPRLLKRSMRGPVRLPQAAAMGLAQAFAILPGISRSGATIVTGMITVTSASAAAEFSFLLAIPAILGGAVLKLDELSGLEPSAAGPYVAGFLAAFVSGWLAVIGVMESIRRGKFENFAYYCLVVGAVALVYFGFIK